jgi:cytochrome d ubiquinol oxidase subunit II
MASLESVWFVLVGVLLVGYAILDGFDLGVGMLHLWVARDDRERRIVLNSIGPVWDGNEVWLLTGGGAIFAAFPQVYATVFSGFYLALMLLLTALVFRAVSLEFRSKEPAARWRTGWDTVFSVSSFLPALLFGVAIGNVLRGLPLDGEGEFTGSFLGLLNPFAVLVGALSVAMFVVQGAAWLSLKTEGSLRARARQAALGAWWTFLALWGLTTVFSWSSAPHLWAVYGNRAGWIAPAVLLAAVAAFPSALGSRRREAAFAVWSVAIVSLIGVMGQGLYPYLVPALGDLSASLTIHNAASSPLTLRTMLVIALLGLPLVVLYTVFIYRVFRGPVVLDETSY